MIERRNWATRPWARRDGATSRASAPMAPARAQPRLWFLLDERDETSLRHWRDRDGTFVVPCFRSAEDAELLAPGTGDRAAGVVGFPLMDVPDLMLDLSEPFYLVDAVAGDGTLQGHVLPAPPPSPARIATMRGAA